ncbi:MAG: translocation protein TolB [Bacteroidota bacterium]
MKKYLSILSVGLMLSLVSYGQQSRETFGQNRIQYQDFNWRYFSTTNFDIYFYGKSEVTAQEVAVYLEDEFDRITEIIGHSPYFKAKVFLYNSVNDLQQSNIGVNQVSYRVGGQTSFTKSYVEVANPGTIEGFKEELITEVSKMVLNDMVFGGSLSDMWQNTYLMNLPDWFVLGAAEYLAKGWDIEMDDQIRDLMISGKVNKLTKLTGRQAVVAGQSLWNFIVEKYGKSNLNQILNLVRVTRNEERSISFTLGLSFKQVLMEWRNYYESMVVSIKRDYSSPNDSFVIDKLKDDQIYSSVKMSPDGNNLAYAINDDGRYHVYLTDLNTKKTKKIISGGLKLIRQKADKFNPIINWSDDNTIGIISHDKGENYFLLYDINTNSQIVAPLDRFDHISEFDFSANGRLAALSATRNGRTDIYLLSVRRNKIRQLTNDSFDDITPSFVPGTNTILFSSNRDTDTISSNIRELKSFTQNYNIYAFNLDTTRKVLSKITNTISKDTKPIADDNKVIYYLSDQKGIVNLFKYDMSSKIYSQVTNFENNIIRHDISFSQSNGVFTMSRGLERKLYYVPKVDFKENVFTPLTPRQSQIQARYLAERRLKKAAKERSKPIIIDFEEEALSDTVTVDSLKFTSDEQPDNEKFTDIINTDDYVFDQEVVRKTESSESFLSKYRRTFQEDKKPVGPFPYQTRFSADNMITSWVFDPRRGFGILLESEMNDMLQNHKFYGGLMSTFNLKSGDIFVEYQYLEQRVDYKFRYDRNVWFMDLYPTEQLRQRYIKSKFEIGASLPLSPKIRLTLNPYYQFTHYQDLNYINYSPTIPTKPEKNINGYLGFSSEFIMDNTNVIGQNMIQGTRIKAQINHNESITDKSRSFTNFSIDFRHYQKIHRSLVLAGRVYYGSFFGRYKHNYLLGGMDNWVRFGLSFDNVPWYPSLSHENNDFYFVEYVTSLRGFDYSSLFGSNALLANLELRLPLVSYFYSGPVRSSFFSNLQLVGFFDIGSSWTGTSPFKPENSISLVTIGNDTFEAEIQTFKNPWMMGYGAGLRTVLLGYFMKLDLAWPIEDNSVGGTKIYLTLGHDF